MERAEASRLGKKAEAPPRRPATNCRRPRLRAARYSRSTCDGAPELGRSAPPPPRRAVRALDLEAALSFRVSRRTSSGPVCRPVCERSAESPRRQVGDEIRSVTGRNVVASTSVRWKRALARARDKSSREPGEQARVTRESSWHNMDPPSPSSLHDGFSAFRSVSHVCETLPGRDTRTIAQDFVARAIRRESEDRRDREIVNDLGTTVVARESA